MMQLECVNFQCSTVVSIGLAHPATRRGNPRAGGPEIYFYYLEALAKWERN